MQTNHPGNLAVTHTFRTKHADPFCEFVFVNVELVAECGLGQGNLEGKSVPSARMRLIL